MPDLTVPIESVEDAADALAEAGSDIDRLCFSFVRRLTPKNLATLFANPILRRFPEIELRGGGTDVWSAFFASAHTHDVTRLEIGAEHATKFARGPWPNLEHLRIGLDNTAADRRALATILAAPLPGLTSLLLNAAFLGAATIDTITRSPAFRQLESLWLDELEPALGDAGIAALAKRIRARSKLTTLRLSIATATTRGLATLARIAARLDHLDLGDGPLDEPRLRALAKVPHIRALSFWGSPSTEGLAVLARAARELEDLSINHALDADHRMCETLVAAKPPRLRRLRVTEAPIGVAGATAIAKLATIEALDLQSSHIFDAGAAALVGMPKLRELELEFCSIRDAGGAALAKWPARGALAELNVNGNHILAKATQAALTRRFPALHRVALLGVQHAVPPEVPVEDVEVPPPVQRPHAKIPPRRRDWKRGLRELCERAHFASWDGYVDAKMIARAEALIDRCVRDLLALGESATAPAQRRVLRRCITGFNRMSDEIYTIEVEDIVEIFAALARYTKLADEADDLADEWRDF